MQDRIPLHPGRVTLTPVDGQPNTYDMVRADQPTQSGDPLNKATLLKDATAEMYNFGTDAIPDDALAFLGKYNLHWWKKQATKISRHKLVLSLIESTMKIGGIGNLATSQSKKFPMIAKELAVDSQTLEIYPKEAILLSKWDYGSRGTIDEIAQYIIDNAPCYVRDLSGYDLQFMGTWVYVPEGTTYGTSSSDMLYPREYDDDSNGTWELIFRSGYFSSVQAIRDKNDAAPAEISQTLKKSITPGISISGGYEGLNFNSAPYGEFFAPAYEGSGYSQWWTIQIGSVSYSASGGVQFSPEGTFRPSADASGNRTDTASELLSAMAGKCIRLVRRGSSGILREESFILSVPSNATEADFSTAISTGWFRFPQVYPIYTDTTQITTEYLGQPFQDFPYLLTLQTGEYTGTGTSGASGPNRITFERMPKIVLIIAPGSTQPAILWAKGSSSSTSFIFDAGANFLEWYTTSAGLQYNTLNSIYKYVALL